MPSFTSFTRNYKRQRGFSWRRNSIIKFHVHDAPGADLANSGLHSKDGLVCWRPQIYISIIQACVLAHCWKSGLHNSDALKSPKNKSTKIANLACHRPSLLPCIIRSFPYKEGMYPPRSSAPGLHGSSLLPPLTYFTAHSQDMSASEVISDKV